MPKVTLRDALMAMGQASNKAKANDWGVEPHHDCFTDKQYIVYIFDNLKEAKSMAKELPKIARVFTIPTEWKKRMKILAMKYEYYGVYSTALQVDKADLTNSPTWTDPQFTFPHHD